MDSMDDLIVEYKKFYNDVRSQVRSAGKVVMFICAMNYVRHLRGNVYVQYEEEEHAAKACELFNGRWYSGSQFSVVLSPVNKWYQAICGLHLRGRCKRGKACNFLHVFKNPKDAYSVPIVPGPETVSKNHEKCYRESRGSGYKDYISKSTNKEQYNSRNSYRCERSRFGSRPWARSQCRRLRGSRSLSMSPRRSRSLSISSSPSLSSSSSRPRTRSRSRGSHRHREESKSKMHGRRSEALSKDNPINSKTSMDNKNNSLYKEPYTNRSASSADPNRDNIEKGFKFNFSYVVADDTDPLE